MAREILTDKTILAGSTSAATCIDLSGWANSFSFPLSVEQLDTTSFADTVRKREAGLLDGAFEIRAQLDNKDSSDGEPRVSLQAINQSADNLYIAVESNASMAEGDACWFLHGLQSNMEQDGQVGEIGTITVSGVPAGMVLHGRILLPETAISSTSTSTGFQWSQTASADQSVYCGLWVTAASGSPTLDVTVESDDNSGFTSATTQITFTQETGIGAQGLLSAAGAITDDYWRVSYTFGGTGSITALVAMGIF